MGEGRGEGDLAARCLPSDLSAEAQRAKVEALAKEGHPDRAQRAEGSRPGLLPPFPRRGIMIRALTVKDILDEQIAKKLA